jgi:hypothetical protein
MDKLKLDKLKLTGQNLGRVFNFKCGHISLQHAVELITKIAKLKVENSARATFRFSPVSFHHPRLLLSNDKPGNTKGGSITVPLTSC